MYKTILKHNTTMVRLYQRHDRLVAVTSLKIVRQCSQYINWDAQMLALRGARGVGKTTIMLQYIKQHYRPLDRTVLYCSLDDTYFATHTIIDLVDQFYLMGGRHLFIDEVHKYADWSRELKQVYDAYPTMRIVLSSSSLLNIIAGEADLSRRCVIYNIQGLSFREFLHFYKGIELPAISMDQLLAAPQSLCAAVNEQCRPLPLFHEYLQYGCYPFYLKNPVDYYTLIEQTMVRIIDDEMPRLCGIELSNTRKVKALMDVLSSSEPFELDMQKLSVQSGLQRVTLLGYLNHMQNAKLLNLLYCDLNNVKRLQKPDKLYIENPNLLYALSSVPVKIGTVRETFAVNQLVYKHRVEYRKRQGDFLIDSRFIFEVGGSSKDYTQLAGVPDSFIFADDCETPIGHKYPLWLLGFLY